MFQSAQNDEDKRKMPVRLFGLTGFFCKNSQVFPEKYKKCS